MAAILGNTIRRKITASAPVSSAHGPAKGHGGRASLWRNLSFFVAMPAVIACMVNSYVSHEHHERPPFIPYEHLRIRNKRFPWGDGTKSLFHNPHTNALPGGYEDED